MRPATSLVPPLATAERRPSFSRRFISTIGSKLTPRGESARERKRINTTVTVQRETGKGPLDLVRLEDVRGVGVVVAALDGASSASLGGLQPGDIILHVGSVCIESAYDVPAVLRRLLGEVELGVSRLEGNGLPRGWKAIADADERTQYVTMVRAADGKTCTPRYSDVHPVALPAHELAGETVTPRGVLSELLSQPSAR
jgi:hypothetical protein